MNKTVVITIGIILGVAIVVVVGWLIFAANQPVPQTSTNSSGSTPSQNSPSDNVPLSNPNVTGSGESSTASVTIQNMAFTPARITVKKGTTVTWTNQDDVGHNVVSDSGAPAGGPPQTAELLNKGEVFSFTYDTVGTFPYHCTPHPFMQGVVEVTE